MCAGLVRFKSLLVAPQFRQDQLVILNAKGILISDIALLSSAPGIDAGIRDRSVEAVSAAGLALVSDQKNVHILPPYFTAIPL